MSAVRASGVRGHRAGRITTGTAIATVLALNAASTAHGALAIPRGATTLAGSGMYLSSVVALKEPPVGARDTPAQRLSSTNISRFSVPTLVTEAREVDGAGIDTVTGATYTSRAFARSLQGALMGLRRHGAHPASATGPAELVACARCGVYGVVQVRVSDALASVAVAADPSGGYWTVNALGVVSASDGAPSLGQPSGITLANPVVAMLATPTGGGYLLVTRSGSVYPFGDASALGSPGKVHGDVAAAAMVPGGGGYWLVTTTGAVDAVGSAKSFGSASVPASSRVAAIAPTSDGLGYWVVMSSGVIESFGNAPHEPPPPRPVSFGIAPSYFVAAVGSPSGNSLLILDAGGRMFAYGNGFPWYQKFMETGGMGRDSAPVVGIGVGPGVSTEPGMPIGVNLLHADGSVQGI